MQLLIRHSVALLGASFGPVHAGKLNVLLWRARARLYSAVVNIQLGPVNYLHVPRTGGTSMKHWLAGVTESTIMVHDHAPKSFHVKPPVRYVVAWRMPSQRLASALARANSNTEIARKVATMTNLQLKSIRSLGRLQVPELENRIRASSWRRRYVAYLSLNCAGELTEPFASWISKKDLVENPPVFAFSFEDSNTLESFMRQDLGLEITDRPWFNRGNGDRIFGPTPNLDSFFSEDLEVIALLRTIFKKV
mgnify:CR=1 FL=1